MSWLGAAAGHECNTRINEKHDKVGTIAPFTFGDEPGCGCGGVCRTSRFPYCDGTQGRDYGK